MMFRRFLSATPVMALVGLLMSGCAFEPPNPSPSDRPASGPQSSASAASGDLDSARSSTDSARPDWSAIAERVAAAAGTDQIVDATLYSTGEARLTLRTGEGSAARDVTWHYRAKADKIVEESAAEPQPRTPVSISDVDWAKAGSAFTATCRFGTATLSWLPNGHHYRDYSCAESFATEAAWLNDNPIPNVPDAPDAEAFQQALDFVIPIIGHSAVQFSYSKKNSRPSFTLVGAPVEGADGSKRHTVVNYEYAFEGDPVLKTQSIDSLDLAGVTSDSPAAPMVTFDPASIPSETYAKAVADALVSTGATVEDLRHAYFEAVSETEIAYSIFVGRGAGRVRGTLIRP